MRAELVRGVVIWLSVGCVLLWASEARAGNDAEGMPTDGPTPASADPMRAARIAWWTEARVGTFLCLDPFALKGWGDAGWHIGWGQITWDQTRDLAKQFRLERFDPKVVAKQIKASGSRYVVFTVKHCSGFSMYDTKLSDWDIMATPYGKDFLAELLPALRAEGLKVGLYFLQWDWSRPEYRGKPVDAANLIRERGGLTGEQGNPQWDAFLRFYVGQVEELMTNYGTIDVLWIDGWRKTDPDRWAADQLLAIVRKHQPDCLVSDRFGDVAKADFITPENYIPGRSPDRPWETCYRANGGWYWCPKPYLSTRRIVRMLVECVSKDGNMLLAHALDASGQFDVAARASMDARGEWLRTNGAAIYGCGAAPLVSAPWGRATHKPGRLYLLVYDDCHPDVGRPLLLEDFTAEVAGARVLGSGETLRVERDGANVRLFLPEGFRHDPAATAIEVTYRGKLRTPRPRWIQAVSAVGPAAKTRRTSDPLGVEYAVDTTEDLVFARRAYPWRAARADKDGWIEITPQPADTKGLCAAAVSVEARADQSTELLLETNAETRAYLNGSMVLRVAAPTDEAPVASGRGRVQLAAGTNTLVLKGLLGADAWRVRAAFGGGSEMQFEPRAKAAYVGGEPDSWAGAVRTIETEDATIMHYAERVKGRVASGDFLRMRPDKAVAAGKPASACHTEASVNLAEALDGACLLIRYGHIEEMPLLVSVDGGEPMTVTCPATGGYRVYGAAIQPLGKLSAGKHTIRVACGGKTAFHLDAAVLADGEPAGASIRVCR